MRRKKRKSAFPQRFFRVFIVFLIFFCAGIYFVFSRNSWDGKSRFTVVIFNQSSDKEREGLSVFSIEPESSSGKYIFIPNKFVFDIPYGYKQYPVYSVYKLGQLDDQRGGGRLLKSSIEATMGIKTDRFIVFNNERKGIIPDNKENFKSFKSENFNLWRLAPFFRSKIANTLTDLTLLEKWKFFIAVAHMKTADFEYINISESSSTFSETLVDKSEIKRLDPDNFDYLYSGQFQNIKVRREEYTLEVQNATGIEKIAGQFSRILNHLGAHVILKTTSDREADARCNLIFYKENSKNSTIAKILMNDYNCVEMTSQKDFEGRSDIRVIIGKEFLK